MATFDDMNLVSTLISAIPFEAFSVEEQAHIQIACAKFTEALKPLYLKKGIELSLNGATKEEKDD